MTNNQDWEYDMENNRILEENLEDFDMDVDEGMVWDEDNLELEMVIKCPACNNIYSISKLEDDKCCPYCLKDLSEKLEKSDFWDNDDKAYLCKLKGCETDEVSN